MTDDDVTEIDEMTAKSVVGVQHPANQTPFIIMKSEAPAEIVTEAGASLRVIQEQMARIDERLAKAAMPDGHVKCPTCKGKGTIRKGNMECPDCKGAGNVTEAKGEKVAKAAEALVDLHAAAQRVNDVLVAKAEAEFEDVAKAKYTAAQKRESLKAGHAIANTKGNPSYPIEDQDDLERAIKAVGRGNATHDATRAHIIKQAKRLKLSKLIPSNWGTDGSIAKSEVVAKDSAYAVLSAGGIDVAPELVPGSPEWEDQDAQALITAGQSLASLSQQLETSKSREEMEVATGHADDSQDVWTLQTAIWAVQQALSIVARMAFREEAEAGVAKAVSLGETEELIRFSLDVCNALGGGTTRTNGGSSAETVAKGDVLTMDITQEELDERVAKAASDAATKVVLDLAELAEADRKDQKAKKVAKSVDEAARALTAAATEEEIAKAAQVLAEAAEAAGLTAEQTTEAIAKAQAAPLTAEEIVALRTGVGAVSGTDIAKAYDDIAGRLDKLEGRPRPASEGPILDGVAKSQAVFAPPSPDGSVATLGGIPMTEEMTAIAKAMETAKSPAQRENLQMELALATRRAQIESGWDSNPANLVASAPRSN